MQVPATRSTPHRAGDVAAELPAGEWHGGRVSQRCLVRLLFFHPSIPACPNSCCPRCLAALAAAAVVSPLPLPPCSTGPRPESRSPTTSVPAGFDSSWGRPSGHRLYNLLPWSKVCACPSARTTDTCTCHFACPARSHCHMPLVFCHRLPPTPPTPSPPPCRHHCRHHCHHRHHRTSTAMPRRAAAVAMLPPLMLPPSPPPPSPPSPPSPRMPS